MYRGGEGAEQPRGLVRIINVGVGQRDLDPSTVLPGHAPLCEAPAFESIKQRGHAASAQSDPRGQFAGAQRPLTAKVAERNGVDHADAESASNRAAQSSPARSTVRTAEVVATRL